MFRIGDFSRIARVSARLLRFYDEIDLFKPLHAEQPSGYRYYSIEQLGQLNRITVLKDLGFSLDTIRDMLKADVSGAELRSMLLLRRSDVERTLLVEAQRLRHIETRIAQIENDGVLSSEDVVVRAEPARRLLSMRRTVASFAQAREMVGILRQSARPLLPRQHRCQLVIVAHSQDFEQDELDLEFGFALDAQAPPRLPKDSNLALSELPAVERMAVCVRAGPPDEAHLVTARVGAFLEQSGEALSGASREAFLNLPDPGRMQDSVVEMQFPLQAG
jgi:DNA-binding transcriptional MerR regulator